jgi:radical SAM superfamily enzyme YgiQ (UPF0313 family)
MPPIGLAYVAAACEADGLSVLVIDCALENDSQTSVGLQRFRGWLVDRLRGVEVRKCIGIGPTTTPALKSLMVAAEVLKGRYSGIPLVYGGPFASIRGQESIFFDRLGAAALVRGDGEQVFPELVKILVRGDIGKATSGVVWNVASHTDMALIADLDSVEFPARHLLDNRLYAPSLRRDVFNGDATTAIYSSRGCPYECIFCISSTLRNRRVVRRSNANIYEEMRHCIDSYGLNGFIFYDDCMFAKSADIDFTASEFADGLMREVGPITWEMELRCDAVAALSPTSLRALASSGCAAINMGIEKGSDKSLAALRKRVTISEIATACTKVSDVVPEMRLTGTFILGGPDETRADIDETIAFATNLPLDFAHFYPMEVYPGTQLFNDRYQGQPPTAWAEAIVKDEEDVCGEVIYESDSMAATELLILTQSAYKAFYGRREWHKRYVERIAPKLRYDGLEVVERWCKDRFSVGKDVD